jgi:hypothetical protein
MVALSIYSRTSGGIHRAIEANWDLWLISAALSCPRRLSLQVQMGTG